MDLYEYPPSFLPRLPDSVSRAARIWCLGGLVWMGAGLFLLFLSFVETGLCPEWGLFGPAMNPGILRQTAVALLVYGWGLPMMWGISLLLSGAGIFVDSAWLRAGAWGWHGVLFGGTAAVLCGHGSGISAMPFPSCVWPVLIFAALPVFPVLTRSLMNGGETGVSRGRLPLMSSCLGLFYLLGGTVSVFWADLPPYYRTIAAECTTYGLSAGVLCSFALTLLIGYRGNEKKQAWFYTLAWLLLVSAQSFVFMGGRQGMPRGGMAVMAAVLGWCGTVALVCGVFRALKSKWRGGCWWIPFGLVLWGVWCFFFVSAFVKGTLGEMQGFWMDYSLLLSMVFFAVFSALSLYEKVPCCTGRDWLSRAVLIAPLPCWMIGIFLYLAGMFLIQGEAGRESASFYWLAQSWVGGISLLVLLMGWAVFALHVILVWSGWGRITAVGLFCREPFDGSEEEEAKAEDRGKGGAL